VRTGFPSKVVYIPTDKNNVETFIISLGPTMTLEKGKPSESLGRKATGLSPRLKG
jgi:hypothetical protein